MNDEYALPPPQPILDTHWPFPTLRPAVANDKLPPFNPDNHEDAPV